MKTIISFFQRLQWKLTLSYVAVTVGTVMVLAVVLAGVAMLAANRTESRVFESLYWSKTAFQDNIPKLLDDTDALQEWLTRVQAEGFTWDDFQSQMSLEAYTYANSLVTTSAVSLSICQITFQAKVYHE